MTKYTLTHVLGEYHISYASHNLLATVFSEGDLLRSVSVIILTGDRILCCDEAIVISDGLLPLGIVTISPQGEKNDGCPAIVGIFVRPSARKKGIGSELLEAAIRRCIERGFTRDIDVTLISEEGKRLIDKLSLELKGVLRINDLSGVFSETWARLSHVPDKRYPR